MPFVQRTPDYILLFSPQLVVVGLLTVSAAMFLLTERRLSLLFLLLQYLLLAVLISPQLQRPVLQLRFGLGVAVCLILYISAAHIQGELRSTPPSERPKGMGIVFHTLALALGGIIAYGLWRRYPLPPMLPQLTLASYWLFALGIIFFAENWLERFRGAVAEE